MRLQGFLALIFIFAFCGCLKQSPDNVKQRQDYGASYKAEKKHCSNITFHKTLFTKKNIIGLFQCLGWNKEFPLITEFFESFNQSEFDNFTSDYNQKYFKNRKSEEKYYKLLRSVNNPKFITDSQRLLKILSTPQRLELFITLIEQTEDQQWLLSRAFPELLKNYISVKNKIGDLTSLTQYSEFFTRDDIKHVFNSISNELLTSIGEAKTREQLLNFVQDGPWPQNYISALKGEHLIRMNQLFRDDYVMLKEQLGTMHEFNQGPGICQVGQEQLAINHTLELYERGKSILELPPHELLFDIVEMVEKFSLYKNICASSPSNHSYLTASENILKKSIDILAAKGSLEFFKQLLKIKLTDDPASMWDFLNIFSSEFFVSYHHLVSQLDYAEKTSVYDELLISLKKLDKEDFDSLKIMLQTLGEGLENNSEALNFLKNNRSELVVNLYNDLLVNDLTFGGVGKVFLTLADFMPNDEEDRKFLAKFFKQLLLRMQDEEFKSQLLKFLSKDSLYDFTSLIGHGLRPIENKVQSQKEVSYKFSYDLFTPECLQKVVNLKNVDFESLVESKIFQCSKNTPNYFFYNIYQWTHQLNDIFQGEYGHKFSVKYGVVSPEMMGFYLNLVMTANEMLVRPDGNYIRDAIWSVKKVIDDQAFIEILKTSLKIGNELNQRLGFMQNLANSVSEGISRKQFNNQRFREVIKNILTPYEELNLKVSICQNLTKDIDYLGCLNKEQSVEILEEVSELLTEKNKQGHNVIKFVLDMLYGHDFKLPVAHAYAKPYQLNFAELLDFFNHVRTSQTKSEVFLHRPGKVQKLSLPLSERLEVLIRDISFNQNFYGLFFMNTASKAYNYMSEMRSLRKQLKLMAGSSGLFRQVGMFQLESSWKFKNVWNTYQSLLDLNGPFINGEGQEHSYTKLIQAIIASTVKASNNGATNFHPYRPPNPALIKGHKGNLITRLSDVSFITRVGLLLERMNSNITPERTARVNEFYQLFIQKIDRDILESFLNKMFTHSNLKLLAQDLFDIQESMLPREIDAVFELVTSFMQSYLKQTQNPMKIFTILEVLLDNYPQIKQNFHQALKLKGLVNLPLMNQALNQVWINDFVAHLTDGILKDENQIIKILLDANFSTDISATIWNLGQIKLDFDLQILKDILLHERIDWMVVIHMLDNVNKSDLRARYLDNVLASMALNNSDGQNNFEQALKTIFSDPAALESFLRNVFEKVQFAPRQ